MSDQHETPARPDWACQMHRRPDPDKQWTAAAQDMTVCYGCLAKVRDTLREVVNRYRCLDPRLSPTLGGQSSGGRGAPGFGSRSPGSDHVIAMRDPASKSGPVSRDGVKYVWDKLSTMGHELPDGVHGPLKAGAWGDKLDVWRGSDGKAHTESQRPPRSTTAVLFSLCEMTAECRGIRCPDVPRPTPPPAPLCRLTWTLGRPYPARIPTPVEHYAGWLEKQLDWLASGDLLPDVADTLRELVADLRPMTGEPGRQPIGDCPNTITGPDGAVYECGAKLFAPTNGSDTIVCHNPPCRREWPRPKWENLGQLLQSGQRISVAAA